MTMRQPKVDLIDRLGRPLLRICGVLFIVLVMWFLFRIMLAILDAFDRAAAEGTPVPDMSGGMASLLTPIVGSLPIIIPLVVDQITRHRERRDQIARGEAPGPFGRPSEQPSPTGGLINNDALEQ